MGRVSFLGADIADGSTQLDLTEEPQVMVPCSQAMSPRES